MLKPLNPDQISEVVRIICDWQQYMLTALERDKLLAKYLSCTERYALRPLLSTTTDGGAIETLVRRATAGRTMTPRRAKSRKDGG